MIELIDFCKSYGSNQDFTVQNINLQIKAGTITGLLGPNGSGKTTILKAICGFHYPTKGKILLTKNDGQVIDSQENPCEVLKNIGYVPEIPLLPKDMYVREFLEYAAEIHGLSEAETEEAINRVIKDCSLGKFLNKKIKVLSKGQQQRVSFAQALIHNPENLILDEPVSGLDPAQINQMRELIKTLSKTKAILMSTHILHEISELCQNVFILSQGTLTRAQDLSNLEQEFIKLTGDSE